MNKTYATIQLGGEARNVERLGTLIAWIVSNSLLDPIVEEASGSAATRVRMQDLSGPEFLTTVLHGEFSANHLSAAGRDFIESYFVSGDFDNDYDSCEYEGENDWHRYSEVSPKISAAYQRHIKPQSVLQSTAKILKFPFGGKRT